MLQVKKKQVQGLMVGWQEGLGTSSPKLLPHAYAALTEAVGLHLCDGIEEASP